MTADTTVILLLELTVMLAATLLLGRSLRRIGLPALVGELFGGIVLGPTVLGHVAPKAHDWLFPVANGVVAAREGLIQFGLLVFLFLAGLEVQLEHLSENRRTIVFTSVLGVGVPLALGSATVFLWPSLWQLGPEPDSLARALLVGTILSISAIAVVARILVDAGLMRTSFASIVMASATINDVAGWTLFGVLLGQVTGLAGGETSGGWEARVVLLGALMALLMGIGTSRGRRGIKWVMVRFDKSGSYVQVILLVMLLAASFAEWIGTHAIFGAFLAGIAVARTSEPRSQAYAALRGITLQFFAPLYMVSIGLRTDFATNFDPRLVMVVLILASVGTLIGATVGARLGGQSVRGALAIGFALNARGVMAIVLSQVALDNGVITERVFVALVVMAVSTSVIGAAAIGRIARGASSERWTGVNQPGAAEPRANQPTVAVV